MEIEQSSSQNPEARRIRVDFTVLSIVHFSMFLSVLLPDVFVTAWWWENYALWLSWLTGASEQ